MIVVFDLDDTLYDEIRYVESGFQAVASFAADRWGLNSTEVFEQLNHILARRGRGQVFDAMLSYFDLLTKTNIKYCIGAYRGHAPSIKLHRAGASCLKRFKAWPMYLVTDGNKLVQYNKVKALGLQSRFRRVMITHRFGVHHAKPSPHCFQVIAKDEGVEPKQVVYIGDNPAKDFVGIKPLGFKTVRVLTGVHREVRKSKRFEAHTTIDTLDELTPQLLDEFQERIASGTVRC